MKSNHLLFVLLFICGVSSAQTKILDSLKNELKKEIPDIKRAKILGDLTWFSRTISTDSSIKYGNEALKILTKINNKPMLAQQYSDMGAVYLHKGNLAKSKDFYFKSLDIREDLKDTLGIAKIKGNLAVFYQRQQKLDSAMIYSIDAMKIFEKKGIKNIANRIKNNIAAMYIDLRAYDKALAYQKEVLEYQNTTNELFFKANTLSNMGNAYFFKADTIAAIKYYNKAIIVAKKSNNFQTQASALVNLGNIFSTKNNYKKAISYFNQSLKIRKKLNLDYDIASTNLSLGILYLRNGNYKKAKQKFKECLPYFEKNKIKDKLITTYTSLSMVYAYEKNSEKVNFYIDKYNIENNKFLADSKTKEITELETKYQTAKKEKEIALQKEELLENQLAIKNRNLYAILVSSALLILGILSYGFYRRNQLKRKQLEKELDLKDALATIKTQNRLQEQRLRISRDLHDNIGSQLSFIISSLDNLQYIPKNNTEKLQEKISGISDFTGETIHQLRDTIWAMNKSEVAIEDLQTRILSFIEKAKMAKPNINFQQNLNVSKNVKFTSIEGMNIFRVLQEAINNAIKYSEATSITIDANQQEKQIIFSVTDNGIGFDINSVDLGNGLANMEKRMNEINAKVFIDSKPNQGTKIRLSCNIA